MIRFAHTADWHIGRCDLSDTERILGIFVDQVVDSGVNLVLHAGDVYDRESTRSERLLVRDLFARLNDHGIRVVVARGNHDALLDLQVFEDVGTMDADQRGTLVRETPSYVSVPGLGIHVLPWFSKQHIAAQAATIDEGTNRANAAARALIDSVALDIKTRKEPAVILGHLQLAGSGLSTGQTLIGRTVEIEPAALDATGASYVALGHIHKRQQLGQRCHYSGGTDRFNAGENEAKGWNLVEIDETNPEALPAVEFVKLPARRNTILELTPADLDSLERYTSLAANSKVIVKLRGTAGELSQVDEDALAKAFGGAHTFRLTKEMERSQRVRCEEIRDTTTTREKVELYLKTLDPQPDEWDIECALNELESLERGDVAEQEKLGEVA